MVPTKADETTFTTYVRNILAVWFGASGEDISTGRAWYRVAHELAEMIGNGDVRKGAGVIAALSPQTSWERNVALAVDACNGHVHGHMPMMLAKVRAILDSLDDPAGMFRDGTKTRNFYQNIVNPDGNWCVTVDRHAHDIAVGERYGERKRGLSSTTRYETIASAYREAARQLGELPSTVQAVTWCAWRNMMVTT